VDPAGWLVKGGGGAQTREKIVAAAAERFAVIVSADKVVAAIGPPIPLELMPFGLGATLRLLSSLGEVRIRDGAGPTPDGGVLADYMGPVGEPGELAARLAATPGVVDHGLFPPEMVTEVLIGTADGSVERREVRAR
jgi:ribose 5-phosphate isomerase A